MHVIQKMFWPNYFFWSALKVPPSDFIQNVSQAPSKCLKKQIKVDKLETGLGGFFSNFCGLLRTLQTFYKAENSTILLHTELNCLKCNISSVFVSFLEKILCNENCNIYQLRNEMYLEREKKIHMYFAKKKFSAIFFCLTLGFEYIHW